MKSTTTIFAALLPTLALSGPVKATASTPLGLIGHAQMVNSSGIFPSANFTLSTSGSHYESSYADLVVNATQIVLYELLGDCNLTVTCNWDTNVYWIRGAQLQLQSGFASQTLVFCDDPKYWEDGSDSIQGVQANC